MKELQDFIEKYTNAEEYYAEYEPDDTMDLALFHLGLVPCGVSRWIANAYNRREIKKPDHIALVLEENLVHPIIAMQMSIQKLNEVQGAMIDIWMNCHDSWHILDDGIRLRRCYYDGD